MAGILAAVGQKQWLRALIAAVHEAYGRSGSLSVRPVSHVGVQKGSRARNAYHHVTVPLGPLQPFHRLLLRRGRSLLGLHRFLQLLPGGFNKVGSRQLSLGAGRLARGGTRCGGLIALFPFLLESRALPTGVLFAEATAGCWLRLLTCTAAAAAQSQAGGAGTRPAPAWPSRASHPPLPAPLPATAIAAPAATAAGVDAAGAPQRQPPPCTPVAV